MLITKDYLKSLSPCEDRYEHYLTHYKDWSGTLEEFLDLPKLTHNDKKWVFVRSIHKNKLRLVAADFAERVLHIYESKYPNDDRPRKAIEAARNGNITDAAFAARADAADAAFADAAFAAYAAFAAARAAARATDAYAAAARAAYAAAAYAAYARLSEEKAQLEIMKRYAREALKQVKTCHHPYDGNMCMNAKPGDKCPDCGMNGYND